MFRSRFSLIALAAATIPYAATAQDGTLMLDEIIVSGGLTPFAADSYARAHTVLTGEEIEARGIATVQDALRGVPGVAVTSTGETLTGIRIRGGESNHVLVLIDGVAANSPGSGDYVFSGMLAEDIERIEILRGPQSSIHGPNAASGVISITTRRAEAPGLTYGGGVELGGQGTRAANAHIRAMGARGAISFFAATRRTDGEDTSRTPGGDRDFNDRTVLGLNGSYDLTETASAGFTLRRSWQEYGYDQAGSYDDEGFPVLVDHPDDYVIDMPLIADRDELYGSIWLEAEAMDGRLLNRLTLSGTNQTADHFRDGVPDYDDAARRRDFRYTGTWAIDGTDARDAAQKLNFAVSRQRETFAYRYSFTSGSHQRDMTSFAVEYQGSFDNGASLQAGMRRDLNDVFRDATSWSIAGAWQVPGRDLRLRAAAGRATVNPDMFQQFGSSGSYRGNPDLRPETTLGYEIGADLVLAGGRGEFGATLFHGDVEDMIVGAGDSSRNIDGTSTRKGAEFTLSHEVGGWLRVGASYTYTDARTESGEPVVRAPRHQLGLNMGALFAGGRGMVAADLRHVAGSHDAEWYNTVWPDEPAVTRLPDFTTVNLAAHYDLTDNVRLNARVVNLFDEDYSEAWGYYGQGRTAYLGLQAKW
ncbi:TonB-dependent receptor plug domain-containing protein [Paracoccus siganidrum]|uniref:TonB-dependent receptor n=1 Tax=Paracoccus siganidrum TaxID=1276757 RepID=A0A419AA53_9RHOB|nr:TonB-dependent receptor [Paracoccus siganidrum]RJL19522.1 TonB-dependent receptor [Paracoccus siganidrum]RMC32235.1 TonB-dependent receptor [Paracoccus siganidrum]